MEKEVNKGIDTQMDDIIGPVMPPEKAKKSKPQAAKPGKKPESTSQEKTLTKKEIARRRNQMRVCWIFLVMLVLITLAAAGLAIYIPFSYGKGFTTQDMLIEMSCCCIAFAAGMAGKWTIQNAIL